MTKKTAKFLKSLSKDVVGKILSECPERKEKSLSSDVLREVKSWWKDLPEDKRTLFIETYKTRK